MDLECKESSNIHQHHETGQEAKGCSRLRKIKVWGLHNLRHVWRIKGVNNSNDHIIQGFQALTSIEIIDCNRFRHLFTPSTINFNLEGLEDIEIKKIQKVLSDQEMTVEVAAALLPSHLMLTLQSLKRICFHKYEMMKVVFDMESCSGRDLRSANDQQLILPNLTQLELTDMDKMINVWMWKKLPSLAVVPNPQQLLPFHNLTNIKLVNCGSIKYLFSPLMVKLLVNLHSLVISDCKEMEEIISNRDDGDEGGQEMTTSTHTYTTFFRYLDLNLYSLPRLKRIGGGAGGTNAINFNTNTSIDQLNAQVVVASWSLCQNSTKIHIGHCAALSSVIPCYAVGQLQKLQEMEIISCKSMVEIFEAEGSGTGGIAVIIPMLEKMILGSLPRLKYIWRNQMLRFPNLTSLHIFNCNLLGHVFTCSMVESLNKLKELKIMDCRAMQMIVKEQDEEHIAATSGVIMTPSNKVLVFPNLQSLMLHNLHNLKGFSLGKHEFHWPMLDKVGIINCREMMVFTYGRSTTPKLKYIQLCSDKHSVDGELNSDLTSAFHKTQFPKSDGSSLCPTLERVKQLQLPWSSSNLIEKCEALNCKLVNIFRSNELLQLQKLEKLHVECCDSLVEVFEVVEGTNSNLNETPLSVEFPELREMTLSSLKKLSYIWKSHHSTMLEFPKLTEVSIVHCDLLQHVFTCSMVGSLVQLQELHISDCKKMEVIVKEADVIEEDDEAKSKGQVLPCLRSLTLQNLNNLKGFCLANDAFELPSLDTLKIKNCPKIAVFTSGVSTTPRLKVIDTNLGLCDAGDDPTSFIKSKIQEGVYFGGDEGEDDEEFGYLDWLDE